MSNSADKVCQLLLREQFGVVAEKIGCCLLRKGPCPLSWLANEVGLKLDKVREILCFFIQHNLVMYEKNKRGFLEYRMAVKPTLWRCRFPKYIYCAKTLYGDAAELLVEEILHHGQVLMNDVVQRVTDRLNEALRESGQPEISARVVYDKFCSLARTHFIMRCTTISAETENSTIQAPDNDHSLYEVPSMDIDGDGRVKRKRSLDESDQPVKRQKTGDTTTKEDGIYWRVNLDRFHQHFRDQAIVAALASKIDKKASEVLRTMLRLSEVKSASYAPVTTPVSFTEIFQALPKEVGLTRSVTEQYLALLCEDSTEIVSKVGNSGGGMYSVNIYKGLISLCKAHVESVVQERFGSKSLRIFRVLLQRKHLEQKQIEDLAMVPAKEAKEILYRMFAQRFVSITEISKTPDHAPSRTFYLFTVNLQQVARMLIQKCYQAMANALIKREAETMEHRRLLDKQERVNAIIATLEQTGADEAQKEEVKQMITPAEKTKLNQVKETCNKLDQAELQLDDTIFILETFIFYTERETCVS
ncbi:hypothetical protein CHS0354_040276 [Potamilus streckersoni]|uniref:DNA-directed RNA polymerase III subunit RPC3 n=1 Tax=Potamilus streckersoni TaxID=2493646 RepID=A0AAE0S4Z0_9BIVA|nr:hypothetical protein CHS0354_040276 [Potamilus streckersoni]